jgi:hypothetical protein
MKIKPFFASFFKPDFKPEDHPHENPVTITQEAKDRAIQKAQIKREAREKRVSARMRSAQI